MVTFPNLMGSQIPHARHWRLFSAILEEHLQNAADNNGQDRFWKTQFRCLPGKWTSLAEVFSSWTWILPCSRGVRFQLGIQGNMQSDGKHRNHLFAEPNGSKNGPKIPKGHVQHHGIYNDSFVNIRCGEFCEREVCWLHADHADSYLSWH